MARGGRRAGRPGVAYPNRTDMNGPLAPTAPTGQPYGARGQQIAAQQALPMGPPGSTSPQAGASGPPPSAPPPALPPPGSLPAFGRPTERPNEPVTHGAASGPGGGPEVLFQPPPDPLIQGVAALHALGNAQDTGTQMFLARLQGELANRGAP